MRKLILCLALALPLKAKADLWGGDLPLLAEIVLNTMNTLIELQKQTNYWDEEMEGIDDRIDRIRTIQEMVEPSNWEKWKDPKEATHRLQRIYAVMPKEYRSEKYDAINDELTKAMNLVAKLQPEAKESFRSGKELESKALASSPGVAQKLQASGTGSLLTVQSQSLAIQSHITSLLATMIAEGNDRETRAITSTGSSFRFFSDSLSDKKTSFSEIVLRRIHR